MFDAQGRVLVVQRNAPPAKGLWSLPGGKLEAGETLHQGVARELVEETGLVVEVGPLVCVVERIGDGFHYVILDYLARPVGGALLAGSDARSARFVSDAELAELPHTDGVLSVIATARGQLWNDR